MQPLFDVHCVKCHGPLEQKSGLELDTPEAILKGGDDGAVISAGKPETSALYLNLASGADPHMPPKKQLSDAEREMVRAWIAAMPAMPEKPKAPEVETRNFTSVTEAIDTLISEGWTQRSVQPAKPVSDSVWCRRVYLDLAGRIPTLPELNVFLSQPAETRRTALVDQLLASPEYPVHMRELWDVFLMGRTKRDNQEDRRKSNGWWAFLEKAFANDRPWNTVVHDFLVARSTNADNKGSAWFLYERRNEFQRIAEAVAPIIYGTKVDCAQCHDHPLVREIKQAHYWALVAAFNRGKNVERGNEVGESAVGGFINFTNLKKESQPALLTLLTGRTVDEPRPAGDQQETDSDDKYVDAKAKAKVPKFSRREAFADAATQENPLLARAFVNRMWAALLGRGIIHPADEMNARNPASHPALLDWLAKDFAAHNYAPRRLIRGIVLSKAYALGAGSDAPPEAFAANIERPLSAEQISRSWRVAAGRSPDDDALRKAVVTALPDVLPKEYNATFQQAQFLTNSPAFAALLKPMPGSIPALLGALPTNEARASLAFLATEGRLPDAEEASQAAAFLKSHAGAPADGVRDLLWALTTSAEFLTMP